MTVLAIAPFLILIRWLIFLFSVLDRTDITITKAFVRNTFTRRCQLLPKHMANFLDNVTPANLLVVFEINSNSAVSYINRVTSMYTLQCYNSANKSGNNHKSYSVNDTEGRNKFYSKNHMKHNRLFMSVHSF